MGALGLASTGYHLEAQALDSCLADHDLSIPVAGVANLRKINIFNVRVHRYNYFRNPELKVQTMCERIMNNRECKRDINVDVKWLVWIRWLGNLTRMYRCMRTDVMIWKLLWNKYSFIHLTLYWYEITDEKFAMYANQYFGQIGKSNVKSVMGENCPPTFVVR